MKKDETSYISLKEASQISGYSPDYIGQLIRSGKLHGKQVYQNVAWMTTAEDVHEYMQRKKNSAGAATNTPLGFQHVMAALSRYLTPLMYVSIGILACLLIVLLYALSSSLDRHLDQRAIESLQRNQSL